jgi:hypothetical protein
MADIRKIEALTRLSNLKRDADLSALARANTQKTAVLARLKALDDAAKHANDTSLGATDPGFLAAKASFGRLVQRKRADINLELARCTAVWLECRTNARISFGRSHALYKIQIRSKNR